MSKILDQIKSHSDFIGIGIVALAILLRLIVFTQDRSLRIDEANLAMNISDRGFTEFFKSLDHDQYAPPLYMMTSKASTKVFGMTEMGLKFPTLLAGILSSILFWLILKELKFQSVVKWYTLLLFAFSILLIRYSTEFKQYAVDMLFTLLVLYTILKFRIQFNSRKDYIIAAIVGSVLVWLSMPIVFVLATTGSLYLWNAWKNNRSELLPIILVCLFWVANFALYFFNIHRGDMIETRLLDYHDPFFFKIFPLTLNNWIANMDLLDNFLRLATDKTALSKIFAGLSFGLGTFYLIKKNKKLAWLLLIPILLTIATSTFNLYSLIDRMIVFLIPLVWIVMAYGIHFVWVKANKMAKTVLIIVLAITLINTKGYEYFYNKMEFEDIKGVMNFITNNGAQDELIFVQDAAVPAFTFYNSYHRNAWNVNNYFLADWSELPLENNIPAKTDFFWVLFSNTYPQSVIDKNLNAARSHAKQINSYVSSGASVYQFSKIN